jgi:hypothetical protein
MSFLPFAGRGQRGGVIEGPGTASFGRPPHLAVRCGVERSSRGATAIASVMTGISVACVRSRATLESPLLSMVHVHGLPCCPFARARVTRDRARARGGIRVPLDGPPTWTDSPDIYPDREEA